MTPRRSGASVSGARQLGRWQGPRFRAYEGGRPRSKRGRMGQGRCAPGSLNEEGSATVAVVGAIAAVAALALFFVAAGTVLSERAQLQAVADVAALQAADQAPPSAFLDWAALEPDTASGGADSDLDAPFLLGCEQARKVARANGAEIADCRRGPDLGDFQVRVERRALVLGVPLILRAQARAGPPSIALPSKTDFALAGAH